MRTTFTKTLIALADRDPRVMLLTADLGYMVFEPFQQKHPERFINTGVAEQNMIGVATGLADAGFIPFTYSIVTFATLRPYEFIRNGPILHQLPVRIVGVGGGFEYGPAGPTHHGLEDIGVMRIQQGITVVAPADALQAQSVLQATWDLPGPVYYRLGKDDKAVVPGLDGRFQLGKLQIIREGSDLLLLSMGAITTQAIAAADLLEKQGIQCTVGVIASLNPPPIEDLLLLLPRFPICITVEAHSTIGGIGSLVSETIAESGLDCRVVRCGVRALHNGVTGSQEFLNHANGLSAAAILQTALQVMQRNG